VAAWEQWLEVNAQMVRAGELMISCLNRISNSVFIAALTQWRDVNAMMVRAGQIMQRTMSRIALASVAAGLNRWREVMEAEQRAGVVMFSCLSRIENAVAGGAWDKWIELLDNEENEKKQRELAHLQAQLQFAQGTKAGKLIRDCLNKICNSIYQYGWDQWMAAVGDDLTAGQRMLHVLNNIVEGLTYTAWQKWYEFNLYQAGQDKVDVVRSGRTAEELKYRLEMELSRRAGRKMRSCLNQMVDAVCKAAWRELLASDARLKKVEYNLGRMFRHFARLIYRHAIAQWKDVFNDKVAACRVMQRAFNTLISQRMTHAWHIWQCLVVTQVASSQGIRSDREKEELLWRLEMELSKRSGRKMRMCLNVIIDVLCKSAFKAWLAEDARLQDAQKTLGRAIRHFTRLHLSHAIGVWQQEMLGGDDDEQQIVGKSVYITEGHERPGSLFTNLKQADNAARFSNFVSFLFQQWISSRIS
jgi:hypothetical protein